MVCFRWFGFFAGLISFTAPLSAAVIDRATALPAAIIVDARDGRVIAESDADEPRIPASLVKMMTLYLVFEALDAGKLSLGQKLKVSADAADQEPTKLGLLPSQTIATKDAILGVVTRSANDAAVVLAEAIAGSEERFTRLMNAKARQLGMKQSLYRNASGLPEPLQSSTARDISILARALLADYPHHYHYFATEQFRFRNRLFVNHNKLLGTYPGVDGIKTGYTRGSGFNIAVSIERDGHRLIAVVLGGNSARSRDERTRILLDGVFGTTAPPTVVAAAPAPARTAAAAKTKPARTAPADDRPGVAVALAAARTYTPPAAAGGGWSVQVGAFRRQASAEKEASRVFEAMPALRGVRVAIETASEKGKALFRARLVGLTEDAARDACSALKRKQFACLPIRPDGRTD
jgi:D-alanyl-D-alanine carboxypeptidase